MVKTVCVLAIFFFRTLEATLVFVKRRDGIVERNHNCDICLVMAILKVLLQPLEIYRPDPSKTRPSLLEDYYVTVSSLS